MYPDAATMPPNAYNPRYHDSFATPDERSYSMFTHLVGMLSILDHSVLGLIGVLIMWRIKKDESPFLDDHGKEALNFQISMLVLTMALGLFALVTLGVGIIISGPAIFALWIVRIVAGIKAATAANRGEFYRYPVCIRFIN